MQGKSNRMYKIDEELKKENSNIIYLELKNTNITSLISIKNVKNTLVGLFIV